MARTRPTAIIVAFVSALGITGAPQASDNEWQFTVVFPMIWAPDISGELDIDGGRQDIDISFSDILKHLDAGLIGEFYAQHGNWSIGWRSMFLGTESESTTPAIGIPGRPPIIGKHEIKINADLFTSDIVGAYQFSPYFGVYSGLRHTGTKIQVKYQPLEQSPITSSGKFTAVDDELLDWIVGVNLDYPINDRWEAAMQLDYGLAGDNDTDIQLNAIATYILNERHSAWFGYRYLEIGDDNTVDGSRVKTSFTQQGPTLGWAFTF